MLCEKEIRSVVYGVIADQAMPQVEVDLINEQTSLIDDLGYDSISITYLIVLIEEKLRIVIEPEEMLFDNFSTPEKIVNLVSSKMYE